PACDWGDRDLALAITLIRRRRPVPLVVFGHMHHSLWRQLGERHSFHRDQEGTAYLNCACVPRHGTDDRGRCLRHFSWVRFQDGQTSQISHRWYGLTGDLLYEQTLWSAAALSRC
ncbi:MAG: TIGR04168 family protein, partial [Synechococcaceae cyanobacterium ELA182]